MTDHLSSKYKLLRFDRDGKILRVTMDSPPLNAAGFDLHDELSYVFHDLAEDTCSVIVLTGEGRAFSAGGDLHEMLANCSDPARQDIMVARGSHIVRGLLDLKKPVIARVNGHAMGLGATLALLCDVAIMVDSARIADPHVAVGISAGDGGAMIWPLLIGFARARHHLMTGEPLTGTQAADIGLIYKAVPAELLDEEVAAYAQRLLAAPTLALSITKQSINLLLKQMIGDIPERHLALEGDSLRSADHKEALSAMLEKRPPQFTGR
jgi:enoyl-CoA hydratase